jgi:hypothetical protein
MSNIAIWDLDNCLSDDGWRIPLIDWRRPVETRWVKYHGSCFHDVPGNHAAFNECAAERLTPLFITGRPESVRALTMSWLYCHFDIRSPMLLMRASGDHRESVDVKLELLTDALQRMSGRHGARIVRAYDDKPDIVQMYRDVFDIDARVLRIHELDAYAAPPAKAAA